MEVIALILVLLLGLSCVYRVYDDHKKEQTDKIYQLWKDNVKKYSDKSTPWLIQFTADMAGVKYMDVVEAIRKGGENVKSENSELR